MDLPNVHILNHPLVAHHLGQLRQRETQPETFRMLVHRLTVMLSIEATRELPSESYPIQTPICETQAHRIALKIGVVPILRAGLGMVDSVLHLLPDAEVWHLGIYRDERTKMPVEYYQKLPPDPTVQCALVVDPMLATGGSAAAAIRVLERWGVQRISMLAIIAAPEGMRSLAKQFPRVQIHACALDEKLNDDSYIVPGLGDAGDRMFNAQAH